MDVLCYLSLECLIFRSFFPRQTVRNTYNKRMFACDAQQSLIATPSSLSRHRIVKSKCKPAYLVYIKTRPAFSLKRILHFLYDSCFLFFFSENSECIKSLTGYVQCISHKFISTILRWFKDALYRLI